GISAQLSSNDHFGIYLCRMDTLGTVDWVQTLELGYYFNFANPYDTDGFEMKLDTSGHIYVSGKYFPTLTVGGQTFNNASPDYQYFVARFDTSGAFQWVYIPNGNAFWHFTDFAVHENDVLVTGVTMFTFDFGNGVVFAPQNRDGFVLRLDSSGQAVSVKGITNAKPTVIEATGDGYFVLGGSSSSPSPNSSIVYDGVSIPFGSYTKPGWWARIDTSGALDYFFRFDGNSSTTMHLGVHPDDRLTAIGDFSAAIGAGNLPWLDHIGGPENHFAIDFEMGGVPVWATSAYPDSTLAAQSENLNTAIAAFDGNTLISGSSNDRVFWGLGPGSPIPAFGSQPYLARLDSFGDPACVEWIDDDIYAMAQGAGSSVYALGSDQFSEPWDTIEIFLWKLLPNCTTQHLQTYKTLSTPIITNMEEGEAFTFGVHPNPGSGKFRLQTELEHVGGGTVQVLDSKGRRLRQMTVQPGMALSGLELDLSDQPAGVYWVRVETDSEVVTKKLVLVK
ncbi:MAG: T9SS type A sorting domain-containing protein, partial [Bacteroidota bacterium]